MRETRRKQRQEGTQTGPERLVRALARLGPTFIKIGQFLALRPDLLPQEYCDELLQLVDQAPPVPWEAIHRTLTEELGDAPEKLFAHIRKRPLAAGSIAQVHLARTHQGQLVAVKVQRPDLPARIKLDLRRLQWLARFVKAAGISPLASPRELIDEIERWLRQEIDFTRELQNTKQMYDATGADALVRVPRPLPELSSRRVLTTEYLHGLSFSELLRLARRQEFDRIKRLGFDPDLLAEKLISITLHQIFRLRFFHADPHPGNLIAMRGNIIGLIDFGLTDILSPSVEQRQTQYLSAAYNNDVPAMYRAIANIFIEGPKADAEAFRREFFSETNRWLGLMDEPVGAGSRSPIAGYMVTLMQLARTYDLRPPTSVLAMYRSLLTAESVAHQLHSRTNLLIVGRTFFRGLQVEQLIAGFEPQPAMNWLLRINDLARTAPGNLEQMLSDIASGRFLLSVRTVESEHGRHLANQRARLITLAILSMGLALLLSLADLNAGAFGPALRVLLWAALILVYFWMALIWRKLK